MMFVGRTRFSLFTPGSTAWRATAGQFASEEAYRNYLYSDERLSRRADIFLGMAVPQIAAAARGHTVRHIVSFSDTLPAKYREQLASAAERYPILVLDEQGPGVSGLSAVSLAASLQAPGPYAEYRLDDDDLLSLDYFDQMAPYVREEFVGMSVTLAKGLTALQSEGCLFSDLRTTYQPMNSMGLLSVCRLESDGTVLRPPGGPHNLLDRTGPVILDARRPSYLQVRHPDQDSTVGLAVATAIEAALTKPFDSPLEEGVDPLALFPVLAGRLLTPATVALASAVGSLDTPTSVSLETPLSGRFGLDIVIECDPETIPYNALISLQLTAADGGALPEGVVVGGTSLSPNPAVGHYRYLETRPGQSMGTYNFTLPPGVLCTGFVLRKWKRNESSISVTSASLSQLVRTESPA